MSKFIEKRRDERQFIKPIVVFYHADCTDGFTAAWVAWKKFGKTAEYIPYFYEDEPPQFKGREIYMLDMTFPERVINRLMSDNLRVTAIDHHISSKTATLMTHSPLYALDHSGCVLTWKYFHPNKRIPQFLLTVEDVDLWRHNISYSKTLFPYLDLFDMDFKTWSNIIRDFEIPTKRKRIIETGSLLFKYENKIIDYNINRGAKLVKFAGHMVYALNTTYSASNAGAKLAIMQSPFGIIWKEFKDGMIGVSLRGDGGIDCSKIAEKYGGGGHKNSAAFRLPSLKSIPWKNT